MFSVRPTGRVVTCIAILVLLTAGCSYTDEAPDTSRQTSASPSTTSTTPKSAPEQTEAIRLLFTGDMLPSDELRDQAGRYAAGIGFDFMPMLAEVAPIVAAADWAVCHQETPVSADNTALAGYPRFNGPFELAEDEAAIGFDACSTASNHTVDLGAGGIAATLGTLNRVGIQHMAALVPSSSMTS